MADIVPHRPPGLVGFFCLEVRLLSELQAVIVVDYQNIHLTGHELFNPGQPAHLDLVHPLHFANQLLKVRNEKQQPGMAHASLQRVLVYRGEPSAEHDPKPYARNQSQKSEWMRDPRVDVVLRPLRYELERDATGRPATDALGRKIVKGKVEKGVDVLCALAVMREARKDDVNVVILASHDTDLEPALDEALELGAAKIETFSWYDPAQRRRCRQIRPRRGRTIWNTRLVESEFRNCTDLTRYA